jgi:hypothetical protein
MARKHSDRPKGISAYRIKRARTKKPIRFLEVSIVVLFIAVAAYAASFTVQMARGHTEEKVPVEYYINLQVLNGCGEAGIANVLADQIEMAFRQPLTVRIVDTDNFDRFDVEKTFVISRASDLTAATLLAQQIGLSDAVVYREIEDNYLDIGATLVLGKDYDVIFPPDAEDVSLR